MDVGTAIAVAVIAAIAGVSGAFLGANIAAQESRADRVEANRVRFADDVRKIAADILQASWDHKREAERLMTGLQRDPTTADDIPTFIDTQTDSRIQELRLISLNSVTADRAVGLDAATAAMYGWLLGAKAFRLPDGTTAPITDEQWSGFEDSAYHWIEAKIAFENAVRKELGVEALPEGG